MEKLTTSSKSVADYFKEKLQAKASGSSTPAEPATAFKKFDADEDDSPRGGLGSRSLMASFMSANPMDGQAQSIGTSRFSSLMSSSFLATASSENSAEATPATENSVQKISKTKKVKKGRKDGQEEEIAEEVEKKRKKKSRGQSNATLPDRSEEEMAEEKRRRKEEKRARKAANPGFEDKPEPTLDSVPPTKQLDTVPVDEKQRRKDEKQARKATKRAAAAASED